MSIGRLLWVLTPVYKRLVDRGGDAAHRGQRGQHRRLIGPMSQKAKVDNEQDGRKQEQEDQWDVEFSDAYPLS